LGRKTGAIPGFSKQYGLKRLLYSEEFREVRRAIDREKQLKGWSRQRKLELIEMANPDWKDLSADWFDEELDSSLRSE
jgi:putative endonuclease